MCLAAAVLSTAARASPPGGSWSSGTPLALHRAGPVAVSVGSVVYLIGGDDFYPVESSVLAYDTVGNAWTYKAAMPTARVGLHAAAFGTVIYAAGGWTGSARSAVLEAYDTVADSWTTKMSMPAPISDGAFAVSGGQFYVFGGAGSAGSCVSSAYSYNPSSDTWTTLAAMPTARCHASAALYNGKIYVMGGTTTGGARYATVEAYDTVGNSWTTKTPMQTARAQFGIGVSSSTIFIVSGSTTGGIGLSSVEAYDAVNDTWSYKAAIPTKREAMAMATANGRFYAFTGTDITQPDSMVTDVEAYDPIGDSWSTPANHIPTLRRDSAAVYISSAIYLFGGQDKWGIANQVSAYPFSDGVWEDLPFPNPILPAARSAPVAAALLGQVWVAGGMATSTSPASTLWSYDATAGTWTTRASMLTAGGCGAAGVIDGKLYVLVSCDGTAGGIAALAVYDPATNAWTSKASAPHVHRYPASAVIGGKLYIAGGSDTTGSASAVLDVYDPVANSWTTKTSMPTARIAPAGGTLGGSYLVAAGGTNSGGSKVSTVEIYDAAADSWSTGASLPTARSDAASVVVGPSLYVIGGQTASSDSDAVEAFTISLATQPTVASVTPSSATTGTTQGFSLIGTGFDATTALSLKLWNASTGTWAATGSPGTAREQAGAVVLPDGRVLVAGGRTGDTNASFNTAEIYDPSSGSWTFVSSMSASRYAFAFVLLSNGKALAVGGRQGPTQTDIATAEIYDPASNTWTPTGSMAQARVNAPAFVRPDGKVLVVGGIYNSTSLSSTEIYDPVSGTWSAGPPMSVARSAPGAATLKDGRFLVTGGGAGLSSAEVYDPITSSWTVVASMAAGRMTHTLTALGDGRVLAAGDSSSATAEIYDPVANTWTPAGSMSDQHSSGAALLVGGKVIVIGGSGTGAGGGMANTDVYNPATNSWALGPTMTSARLYPTVTALNDGRILTAAGATNGFPTPAQASAELLSTPATTISAGVSVADSRHLNGTVNLTGAAAGYWDVVVGESGGRVGRLPNGFAVSTVQGGISFSGAAAGTSGILWSWAPVAGQAGFRVLTSTGGDRSGALGPATTTWLETGLTADAAATRRLFSFDAVSSTQISPLVTAYTLALPPSGSTATAVYVSSASLSWSLNGNPPGLLASVERSTDSVAYAVVLASGVTSFTDSGLASCTTYYYRVRDFNGGGLPTAYDATVAVRTKSGTPLPPGTLTAQALSGALVSLAWQASPSANVTAYQLFMGTGALSYAAPYAVLPATATSFVTPALSTAAIYRFGLRAFSACAGADDGNVNVVASATPLVDASGVSAAIRQPESGKKVSGDRITVMAQIVSGDSRRVRDVRFQYRTAASTFSAWADIPAADVQRPNPATVAPYFIHWNVTGLPNGSYELRAVAELLDGTVDPAPPTVVIGVDAVSPDEDETDVGGSHRKDETVYNGAQRTVGTADNNSGAVVEVTLPTGCVNSSTDTLSLVVNPPAAPPPNKGLVSAGQDLQVTLGSGQTSLNGTATIVMHYPDAQDRGVVDGLGIGVDKLAIYSYNVGAGEWRKESATVVDRVAKTFTATTPHFSLFGLFAVASSDLSNVLVYPVPWLPNAGDPNTGKPYNPADPTSGVVFDSLTSSVRIQIFSASGSLVWDYSTASSGGRVQWDGRNQAGRDAASGGYIVVITDRTGAGGKVVRKIAIIR